MLAGQPARVVYFDEAASNPPGGQYIGQLPGDLDGATLPPAGSPNLFAEVDDPSTHPADDGRRRLRPAALEVPRRLDEPGQLDLREQRAAELRRSPVAPYVRPQCVYGYGDCVPQKGGPQELDVLGDRLMFRMHVPELRQLRVGAAEPHRARPTARTGIRWYEVRIPKGGAPSIYQQGTYAPDRRARPTRSGAGWAAIAQDKRGDIAARLQRLRARTTTRRSATPGRAAGDPLGQMTQAEQVAYTGTGPQTEAEGRWGDYSDLTVDPSDDCTFWYTQEYLAEDTVVIGTWRTRVVSFKFPGCKK